MALPLPDFIKNRKIVVALTVVGAVLLLVAGLLLFRGMGGRSEEGTSGDSSTNSATESSGSENSETASGTSAPNAAGEGAPVGSAVEGESVAPVEPEPVTLTGMDISSLDLCVVLPADSGIKDPNLPKSKANLSRPVTTKRNGKHSEVSLRFSDNIIAGSTMPVLLLQGFSLGDTPAEEAIYLVEADAKKVLEYSYSDIADKIVYQAPGKLVLDVAFAAEQHPQAAMEQYIAQSQGKPLRYPTGTVLGPQHLLADGSYVYKYDWMQPAADYLRGQISQLIMPIEYSLPLSLEALGYRVALPNAAQQPLALTAVTAATVKDGGENAHSGLYIAPVYGGERLLGEYTVLQPGAVQTSPGNPTSFALLQAFSRSELERSNAAVKFLRRTKPKNSDEDYYQIYSDGPFGEFSLAPDQLEDYVVFRDDAIVVYDFFEFSKAPPLEDQLIYLAAVDGYQQYGTDAPTILAARNALLAGEDGLGRYIRKGN